jgi:hypothetical protein
MLDEPSPQQVACPALLLMRRRAIRPQDDRLGALLTLDAPAQQIVF